MSDRVGPRDAYASKNNYCFVFDTAAHDLLAIVFRAGPHNTHGYKSNIQGGKNYHIQAKFVYSGFTI